MLYINFINTIMWQKSYSIKVKNVTPESIWAIWSDFSKRKLWDDDIDWLEAKGSFAKGAKFTFKPLKGPKVKMEISECIPNKVFTDCSKLMAARLYGIHEMEMQGEELCLNTTIKITGPLAWLWGKFLGEAIFKSLPHQTDLLIKLANS